MSYAAKLIGQREPITEKCQFFNSSPAKLSLSLDLWVQMSLMRFSCLKKQPGKRKEGGLVAFTEL